MLIKNQHINILNISIHCKVYLPDNNKQSGTWIILLHQGLGSIPQWKQFPDKLFKNLNLPMLLYERIGYGETGSIHDVLPDNFLTYEATKVLPEIIRYYNIQHYYLVGHSDGGTISLLHAANNPVGLIGLTALTPHVFVEPVTIQGIQKLIKDYETGILKYFLVKYHFEKTDVLFQRWTSFWLSPTMISWNMFDELKKIKTSIQTIQGDKDEFGTLKQLEYIARLCPFPSEHVIIENCHHNPHLEYLPIVVKKLADRILSITKQSLL